MRVQKLLRGKKSFVLRFVAFLRSKSFLKKKLSWNCPDNLIYNTTEKLLSEKIRGLRDAMPRLWLLCFLHHRVTYRVPCHPSGHLVIYCECYRFERAFFTLRRFLLYTPSCWFNASLRAGSSTSKVAGLHADLWNIAPARLFVWITTIHKRG